MIPATGHDRATAMVAMSPVPMAVPITHHDPDRAEIGSFGLARGRRWVAVGKDWGGGSQHTDGGESEEECTHFLLVLLQTLSVKNHER